MRYLKDIVANTNLETWYFSKWIVVICLYIKAFSSKFKPTSFHSKPSAFCFQENYYSYQTFLFQEVSRFTSINYKSYNAFTECTHKFDGWNYILQKCTINQSSQEIILNDFIKFPRYFKSFIFTIKIKTICSYL